MLVEFDKDTGQFELNLPDEAGMYFDELNRELNEEFAFEPINKRTINDMNNYVKDWLTRKGVKLPNS